MLIRPNTSETPFESRQKNDLYRKFHQYFSGATEKEFRQYDYYGKAGYISVNPLVESRILDVLKHNVDEILPLVGATGVGKTYLLLYCLKVYYNVDNIPSNTPALFPHGNGFDLVYYSDFNITETSVLEDPRALCFAKIQAMYERVKEHFNILHDPNVEAFIQDKKLEIKFYGDSNKEYEKELYKLSLLLDLAQVPLKNIVFVFDDLESLTEDQQFLLMHNFLILYENLKSKTGKYCSKFFFCLRNNTYHNIYKQDFYNTHRANKAEFISLVPSLSEIFEKRFDIILRSDKVNKGQNKKTWEAAKKILIDISERVDRSYAQLLLKLNNNNISKALDDFLNIISNRRWTQRNMNPAASFTIEGEDYYINDINILRILSMGERDIYYPSTQNSIRCILPKPGESNTSDFISLLVLQAFRYRNNNYVEDNSISSRILSKRAITNQIIRYIVPANWDEAKVEKFKAEIGDQITFIFEYYEDNRFIHKNVNPQIKSGDDGYYMLPRGEQTFDLFLSRSILFTIYRDNYLLDSRKFDTRCSKYLTFEKLLIESLKYEEQLIKLEKSLFQNISDNMMWRNYISTFGSWSLSESFLNGLDTSIKKFYRDKMSEQIPSELSEKRNHLHREVRSLTKIFEEISEEDAWF